VASAVEAGNGGADSRIDPYPGRLPRALALPTAPYWSPWPCDTSRTGSMCGEAAEIDTNTRATWPASNKQIRPGQGKAAQRPIPRWHRFPRQSTTLSSARRAKNSRPGAPFASAQARPAYPGIKAADVNCLLLWLELQADARPWLPEPNEIP